MKFFAKCHLPMDLPRSLCRLTATSGDWLWGLLWPDTGQVIGSAVNGGIRFGTEVVMDLFFVTQRHALAYIKELCKVYLNRSDVDFIVEESDVPLVMPTQKQSRLV